MSIWAWLLAPIIGLLLAMFGAGGGMTTVPLLLHVLNMPLKEAIASSLWIVAAVSLAALVRQHPWRQLKPRLLAWFAAGGILGSWSGAHLGMAMPEAAQSLSFGGLTWFVAWWMHRPGPTEAVTVSTACQCMRTLVTGTALGIVTGALGVGGGFLMVPALLWLGVGGYRLAVAHSLVLITLNASVAGLGYLDLVEIRPVPVTAIALLAMAGALLGNRLLRMWPASRMQGAFSVMLLLIGGVMIAEAVRDWTTPALQ